MADFVQTMKDWLRMCNTCRSHTMVKNEWGECGCYPRHTQPICKASEFLESVELLAEDKNSAFARLENKITQWATEHPEPVYPTWGEWLVSRGMLPEKWDNLTSAYIVLNLIHSPIPADVAETMGIEPKEGNDET